MVTAKILAIIAVILSTLLTIRQQTSARGDTLHAASTDASDQNLNFSTYDLNRLLESYGR